MRVVHIQLFWAKKYYVRNIVLLNHTILEMAHRDEQQLLANRDILRALNDLDRLKDRIL
jgi:hypothetical protein